MSDIKYHDERAHAIALFRKWITRKFKEGAKLGQVDAEVRTAMTALLDELRTEFEIPGVRYWEHPESDSFFTTGPGEHVPETVALECVELARHEFLSRQGLTFGYGDSL